jgi:RNA polymerase sigma-70 factor (ECF subfamily)
MEINSLQNLARDGDQDAERRLFEILSARFRLFAERKVGSRQDAEEIVQDAILVVLKKYRQVEIESSFTAWSHKVLEYEILRYHKKRGTRDRKFGEFLAGVGNVTTSSSDPTLKRRLLACLKEIGKRSLNYARLLNLHYQGYTTDEVCERLNLTRNHSYVVLSRARSLLVACLERGSSR